MTGWLLLFAAVVAARSASGEGRLEPLALIFTCAWALSLVLTQKYTHKYPQRYLSYLLASHLKAALSMAFGLGVSVWIFGRSTVPPNMIWKGFILFSLADAVVSLIWRRNLHSKAGAETPNTRPPSKSPEMALGYSEVQTVAGSWAACRVWVQPLVDFIEKNVPDVHNRTCQVFFRKQVRPADMPQSKSISAGLVISDIRLNDVRRLNKFFLSCADRLEVGGYIVGRYLPLENAQKELRRRFRGPFYCPAAALHFICRRAIPKIPHLNSLYFFLTKGRNRVFSRTEIWGRLESCGMRVMIETVGDGEVFLSVKKVGDPVPYQKPSYYPLIALDKVGLAGGIIKAHKIRTMYPFSEFLQNRIYEAHSLETTGKFAGDFRITRYGRFLRKYWIDELPQILDWWHGDIKFVGLRAMSRHYFSLYSEDFQEMYRKVKPGLIPPIFSESTAGFDQIVEVEQQYVKRYLQHPLRTDTRYFFKTMKDIIIKGVRSH
jgi:lipopolysaccharide/colanic/teichoic acid biosynthesis glycosyltransferase